jgi:two-component system, cell cycle sensor histidine kinase and response regulator CckA
VPEHTRESSIELSPELLVIGLDGAAAELYGVDAQRVLERPLESVLMSDEGDIDWAAHWKEALAGDRRERVMLHRSMSGLRVWVCCRLEPHAQGGRLLARAASGRDVLEREPGGLVQALERMLAVGGVGLWMDDRVTDEFDWSPLARALHDLGPDVALTPALLFAQIHPDDRAQAAAEIQRGIAERIPYDGVLRVKHGERDYRHLRVFGGTSYDSEGLPLLSVGGVRDISEEVALRRRVRELEDQLRAAQRGDVVGRLAGGIAHDFNNILTGILGCCEMLGDGHLSPRNRTDVNQIRAATLRAADLTRQLLAFGRRQALRRRAVEPGTVLTEVIALLRRTVPENVDMQLDPSPCEGRVLVDVTQLHQVLTNLVVNAAQAMPEGGKVRIGAVQVSLSAGEVSEEQAGQYIRFSVDDSGPGVPQELQARIFEPFFSTKSPGQGSGLGLSVVQGIVEQHLGHIAVRSGPLGGARFDVFLPVTREAPIESDPPEPRSELPQAFLRILLVEDEKMVRELTKRILVGAGYPVVEAADAEEALARAAEAPFDVLLTDVVLPTLSGPEVVRRLRQRGLEFRVVYMSGYPADFVDSRVQLGGSEILVHKPFTAVSLLQALRQRPR